MAAALPAAAGRAATPADPLPSWAAGAAKRSILDFVSRVSDEGSPDLVPVAERIAVFDNDGTLWPENPMPFQLAFALDELKRRLPDEPAWKEAVMVQAALEGDLPTLLADHYKGLFHIVELTGSGMTTVEFADRVRNWFATATHPRFERPSDQLAYQPMLALLQYRRDTGFKTC
ncbi:MAG: haloacid dehalogenase-like hydrolase, partial [Planctomycetaceae bacterium]